MPSVQKL